MLKLSPPYWLFTTTAACWKCGGIIPVVAVGTIGGVEIEEDGEEFSMPGELGSLNYVTRMPTPLLQEIEAIQPTYRLGQSATYQGQYYANHCIHCSALIGDHYVHSEPDESFFKTDEREALSTISVRRLSFAEPAEIEGSMSWSSVLELVLDTAEPGTFPPKKPNRRRR